MTFSDFMKGVRDEFRDSLGAFLGDRGLSPVTILDSAIRLEKRNLSLAIFPTKTNGSTFEEQMDANIVRFTVMLYCNGEASDKGLTQGEEYYSAVLEFIQTRTFGDASTLDASVLCRMDEGEAVNGAVYLISSRISSSTDYGWD